MSDKSLKETKEKLDSISSSFCAAKWKQVTIHLENGTTHSCHHPRVHKIPLDELKSNPSALHNTNFKKLQRKKMLKGERPSECDYCWRVEDLNDDTLYSDRFTKSDRTWAKPYIDSIKELPWNYDIAPSYLEVSFSNVCNFKCSYCSPSFSSKWMEEIKQYGEYASRQGEMTWLEKNNTVPIPVREHNPYIEAFWKWWPEVYPELQIFRITGGEPLLSKETFKVLDYFIENPHPDLGFAVNTNLGVPDDVLDKFIEKIQIITKYNLVKDVTIYTSIEGWGERAAYIRHGMIFDKFIKNVERILNETGCDLTFMCAFNILSVTSFKQFLEKVYEWKNTYKQSKYNYQRVLLNIPYVRSPTHQNIQILPVSYISYIDEIIRYMKSNMHDSKGIAGFHDYEIDFIYKIRKLIDAAENKNINYERAKFYDFFTEHDKRRGTNFLKIYPEMSDFWELTKLEYEKVFKK